MNAIKSSVFMYSVKRFYCFIRMFFQTCLFKKVNIKCHHGNLLNGTYFLKNRKSFTIFAELTFASEHLKISKFHRICFWVSYFADKFGRICVCV